METIIKEMFYISYSVLSLHSPTCILHLLGISIQKLISLTELHVLLPKQ